MSGGMSRRHVMAMRVTLVLPCQPMKRTSAMRALERCATEVGAEILADRILPSHMTEDEVKQLRRDYHAPFNEQRALGLNGRT